MLAALVFCSGVFLVRGGEDASAWLAAYVLEESLSIDNLFVFTLIFSYFQTPLSAQVSTCVQPSGNAVDCLP